MKNIFVYALAFLSLIFMNFYTSVNSFSIKDTKLHCDYDENQSIVCEDLNNTKYMYERCENNKFEMINTKTLHYINKKLPLAYENFFFKLYHSKYIHYDKTQEIIDKIIDIAEKIKHKFSSERLENRSRLMLRSLLTLTIYDEKEGKEVLVFDEKYSYNLDILCESAFTFRKSFPVLFFNENYFYDSKFLLQYESESTESEVESSKDQFFDYNVIVTEDTINISDSLNIELEDAAYDKKMNNLLDNVSTNNK